MDKMDSVLFGQLNPERKFKCSECDRKIPPKLVKDLHFVTEWLDGNKSPTKRALCRKHYLLWVERVDGRPLNFLDKYPSSNTGVTFQVGEQNERD